MREAAAANNLRGCLADCSCTTGFARCEKSARCKRMSCSSLRESLSLEILYTHDRGRGEKKNEGRAEGGGQALGRSQ